MKKLIGFILGISVLVVIISSSCSGDTYAKRLDEENKLIKKFRVDSGLTFRTSYPEDGIFKEKEYFYYSKGDTAVYFRVINPGDKEKMAVPYEIGVSSGTEVFLRFSDAYAITGKTPESPASNDWGSNVIKFTYGETSTYSNSYNQLKYSYMSYALAIPLRYVGDGAEVSLIVPFRSGSEMQNSYYITLYYGLVKYKFKD